VGVAIEEAQVDLIRCLGKSLQDRALIHAVAAPGASQAQDAHLTNESAQHRPLVRTQLNLLVNLLPPLTMASVPWAFRKSCTPGRN